MNPPRGGPRHEHEAGFRTLYESTYDDLLRFVQRRVHPSHAEDVVAETMLVAWRRVEELPQEAEDARAWLFGTARHVLLNARRSDRRRGALAVRIADGVTVAGVADEAEDTAGRLDLVRAWRLLAPRHQEVLALTVWDGLTSAGAAQVLDVSPVAYRLRLSRARRALRALHDHQPARVTDRGAASERTSS